jgi:hypothetical protein
MWCQAISTTIKETFFRLVRTPTDRKNIGSKIIVPVTEDFKIASVHVKIDNDDGSLVEEGAAVMMPDGIHWEYIASVLNGSLVGDEITITATDMAGNAIIKQKTM